MVKTINMIILATISVSFLIVSTGCTSAKLRSKTLKRDRIAQDKKFYCDTVNSDEAESVEVELNLQMAQKCDPTKPHSISHFKNDSGESQVIYCCSVVEGALQPKMDKTKKSKRKKSSSRKGKSSSPAKDKGAATPAPAAPKSGN